MPTFFDSTADAAEASEALRGLAHAILGFDQPAEMYGVIGDLSAGMRSLRQALDQIADAPERKAAHAFNDSGNHEAGVRDALAAAEELHQAANLVDRACDRLAEGFIATRIGHDLARTRYEVDRSERTSGRDATAFAAPQQAAPSTATAIGM